MRSLVWIESPYSGQRDRNVAYARKCCADSIRRGEHPFASHLFYTQFLDDDVPEERELGIKLSQELLMMLPIATVAFYTGLGWSDGMKAMRFFCDDNYINYVERNLDP